MSAAITRITETGGRAASALDNGLLRVLVDDLGGMVPELSAPVGNGRLNAHWQPAFRANGSGTFDPAVHGAFWKVKLLHHIAGNFPCVPNFGPGHRCGKVDLPPHGWSANDTWLLSGVKEQDGAVWAEYRMDSPDAALPLSFRKIDALVEGQAVHYSSLEVRNRGSVPASVNVAWHNTIGAPFLQAGCRLSAAAEAWTTPPAGGEFDTTGRLAIGKEFESLSVAPLRSGGTADLSAVPGPIGYTDFTAGAIPSGARLGWSAVTNPAQGFLYLCFFPGGGSAGADDIVLRFNELWMQYGGRPFTPWAAYEGGTDTTYCLGTENAAGAYANGLAYALEHPSILGAPTTVTIPAGESRILRYGTLFAPYGEGTLDSGVSALEGEKNALVCRGKSGASRFAAEADFRTLKSLEALSLA